MLGRSPHHMCIFTKISCFANIAFEAVGWRYPLVITRYQCLASESAQTDGRWFCPHVVCGNYQVGTLADPNMDNLADVGETVNYDMIITNTGNVRMSNIEVR